VSERFPHAFGTMPDAPNVDNQSMED